MAKRKFYAVKVGKIPGIYQTWAECTNQTDGISGAEYKSFSTLEEAEQYLQTPSHTTSNNELSVTDLNAKIEERISSLDNGEIVAFVDGSYDDTQKKSAFGVILFSCDGGKEILYKAFTKHLGEEFISLRNVAAELEGVKEAVCWAIKCGKEKITIFYDYEGIEAWETGRWKANNKITKEYVDFIRESSSSIEIDFKKVPAHSGVVLNEEVDSIAKKALLTKGYKAYDDGSVYFVGYGAEDWETIIHFVNDENAALTESARPPITLKREKTGTREKITIIQKNNKVIVNCYNDSRSYVQGKQTVFLNP